MLEDKYNILNIIRENHGVLPLDNIADLLIEGFKSELMSDKDKNLINMIFSSNPTQEKLDDFLAKWDIEAVGSAKALMLAYFMKMHPELNFSEYVGPRLSGLLRFYKFQNMKLISHYTKICNELKKENIIPLIFKGGAMKHLRPEFPRVMGDIDVLVKENEYQKAGNIAEKMGYDCAWDIHSVDLHPKDSEEGIMDIHKYIYMNTGFETNVNDDLFKRARKEKVFGMDTLVPSNEDLLFISLVNMTRNLTNKTSWHGVLFTLFDVKYLLESKLDFDWNIVVENARKTKTEMQVCFATKFINNIVPNLLPENIQKEALFNEEINDYCILLMYQRFFLWNMKQKSHALKFKDIFKNFDNFIEYLRLKPKYFFLKLFIFRKNPKLAKLILKLNEKYNIGE